jgi:hypothetical protein
MSPEEWLASQQKAPPPPAAQDEGNRSQDEGFRIDITGVGEIPTSEEAMSPEDWLTSQEAAQPAPVEDAETTLAGLVGAATRGLTPVAGGALAGAALGFPIAGVGAVPGALAGGAAAALAPVVADPIVGMVNRLFGTNYSMPSEALEHALTRVGVPQARTEAERILQTVAAGASGARAGGQALGQTLQQFEGPVTRGVGRMLAQQPTRETIAGGLAGGAAQTTAELGGGPVSQMAAGLVAGVSPFAVGRRTPTSVMAPERGLVAVEPERGLVERGVTAAQEAAGDVGRFIRAEPTRKEERVKQILQTDPYNEEAAGFKLQGGVRLVEDATANEALRQGWRPKFIASLKASSPEDYSAARKMINLYELGTKRANITKRPYDIVGDTMADRLKYVNRVKNKAGKELETAANELKGKAVDFSPAINRFVTNLQEMGVTVGQNIDSPDFTVGRLGVSLRGSDIEGDPASRRLLETIFKRMSTDTPDAYAVHRAKRFIDNQVEFGKKTEGLVGDTERVVKALRFDLNNVLRDFSENYAMANTKYSEAIGALDDLRSVVGAKVNLEGENVDKALGQESRKLLSNYQSRVTMIDALDNLERTARKYGFQANDSITNQVIVANEIDRMFGTVAETSIKGIMEQAGRTGIEVAQGGVRQAAMDLAAGVLEKVRGINEENAVKSIKKLLEEKPLVRQKQ